MSIFGTIMSKVFGHSDSASSNTPAQPASPQASDTPAPSSPQAAPSSGSTPDAAAKPSAAPSGQGVDVAKVLDGMESHAGQTLDWRHSIVDLMKLLDMDSSLHARKELAGELHYTGDTNDSAAMNMWLHKEVMQKFADNGGKLPADLAH